MRGPFADGAPMGVAAPVAEGVAVVPGFANVIASLMAQGVFRWAARESRRVSP